MNPMSPKPSFGGTSGAGAKTQRTEIGALWKKLDRNGNEYFSAKVKINGKDINLNFFQNRRKEKPTQPDFQAFEG